MNPIHIFSEAQSMKSVTRYLESYGFEKLVEVSPLNALSKAYGPWRVVIQNRKIQVLPDWFNQSLPVLFPADISLTKQNLVSIVMYASGLIEDALSLSEGKRINRYLKWFSGGATFNQATIDHVYAHNLAIMSFYEGQVAPDAQNEYFVQALATQADVESKALTALHYAVFLQDNGLVADAIGLLQSYLKMEGLTEPSRKALELEYIRCASSMNEVWDKNELIAHKARVWEVYSFYRDQQATMLEAQLCREMAEVAHYEENYAESLSYISKCIHIYMAEQMLEMEAEANLFKGTLLHQWAKTGSPQFYQQSVKCYQKALHVFKKDEVPHLFAQIHHQLGVLYAEMPDDQKKRSIWAAVSATSFKEALSYFNKARSPYEYATVCHNYATALMQYPDAVRSDNVAKAINLFEEALIIRTEAMPEERSITLLNYLEACWEAENINETIERVRVKEMQEKALEAYSLAPSADLKERATEHLNSINKVLQEVTI